jgi:hypothetical protein
MMFARNTSGNNAYYYTYAYFKSSGNSPTGLVEISSNAAGVASSAGTITFSTGTYGDSYIKAAHETGKGSLTMSIVRML